ncbi:hypothetical protein Glove_121g91 [Diversispora epigaea]|uniref:Uncharacterized protein n=1 Tax=Diversispora epigaea TaxID=1348612 RepID=A0A397IZA4_9GLOM|nr:hypothetical protein Glove_121g91 [Diversispora epigaea]
MVLDCFSCLPLKHSNKCGDYFTSSMVYPICNKDHKKENIRENIGGFDSQENPDCKQPGEESDDGDEDDEGFAGSKTNRHELKFSNHPGEILLVDMLSFFLCNVYNILAVDNVNVLDH